MDGRFFFARWDGGHFIKCRATDRRFSALPAWTAGKNKGRHAPFPWKQGVAKSALGSGSCHVTRSTGAFARATLSLWVRSRTLV